MLLPNLLPIVCKIEKKVNIDWIKAVFHIWKTVQMISHSSTTLPNLVPIVCKIEKDKH